MSDEAGSGLTPQRAAIGEDGGYIVPSTTPGRVQGGLATLPVQPKTMTLGIYYRFVGELTNVRQFNLWIEYVP